MISPGRYEVVTEDEWQRWPSRYATHTSPWMGAIDALERGEIVRIYWDDRRELKSITMAIARRAGQRGFRVLTRDAGEIKARLFRRAPTTIQPPHNTLTHAHVSQ